MRLPLSHISIHKPMNLMPENFSLKITVGDTSIEGSAMNPDMLAQMMQDAISKIPEIKKARAS
jgi:hypothetical protein